MRKVVPVLACIAFWISPEPSLAAGSKWTPILDLRLRGEFASTPRDSRSKDGSYSLGLIRVRVGGTYQWTERLSLHGLVQGAATTILPLNAAFGAGPVYRATNADDRTPLQIGVAELSLQYRTPSVFWELGRLKFAEGSLPSTGLDEPDLASVRRLSERLVGNLDFPNVGRRFEGGTLRARLPGRGTVELFALEPLVGAFHYEDAFSPLDISLFGGSWSSATDGRLPGTSVRLFALRYDDHRTIATTAVGGAVEVDTAGFALLEGGEDWSVLAWLALQRGKVGARNQSGLAWILDAGYRIAAAPGKPAIHVSVERASGDHGGRDDGGFFNLLPTNHKFYGTLDYSAFTNLQDLSVECRWRPEARWHLSAAWHDFRLVEQDGPWVGGSGAFSDREFGYVYRRPREGRFESDALGQEFDVGAAFQLHPNLALRFEGGRFYAGAAARQLLSVEGNGNWLSMELSVRR